MIDEIPILAVAGTQLAGGLEIRDAAELRIKESDRIAAIVENLRRMNASVEEFDDGFRVERSELHGAAIESFGDHRIAMAFAVAGLFAKGETEIRGAESAAVSFPAFFDTLDRRRIIRVDVRTRDRKRDNSKEPADRGRDLWASAKPALRAIWRACCDANGLISTF